MKHAILIVLLGCCLGGSAGVAGVKYVVSGGTQPPAVPREFRGIWVASVANIDWPSRKGLSSQEQRRELLELLERAVRLRANAIILQVRPSCDALYQSSYEPWSEYLSGTMGVAPSPYYDPLQFAVEEAHRRGLELHAWFNPFRARHSGARSRVAANHIMRTQPALVRRYESDHWLDPGERAVQQHGLKVILDVVRRYDIDAVHLDDYFYPYPGTLASGRVKPFPDEESFGRYRQAGGRLDRNSWRRSNVNGFVHALNLAIKREKPWVKLGLSPFGIWRPGVPPQIRGLDAYDHLYADARLWLREGWLDYCSPQLYWPIDDLPHSFPVLLEWWASQNVKGRHLWPGLSVGSIGAERAGGRQRLASEVLNQVALVRRQPGVHGQVFWNMKALREDRQGLARQLTERFYTTPALVPASPWLDRVAPSRPQQIQFTRSGTVNMTWVAEGREVIRQWVVQTRFKGTWRTSIISGGAREYPLPPILPDVIALSAVDRAGNRGQPLVLEKRETK